jgi:hypothetical protein
MALSKMRIYDWLFAGYSPKEYATFSWKALAGGFAGIFVGWGINVVLTSYFGIFYALAAWPGYAAGYFVNIRVQAALKNFQARRS